MGAHAGVEQGGAGQCEAAALGPHNVGGCVRLCMCVLCMRATRPGGKEVTL